MRSVILSAPNVSEGRDGATVLQAGPPRLTRVGATGLRQPLHRDGCGQVSLLEPNQHVGTLAGRVIRRQFVYAEVLEGDAYSAGDRRDVVSHVGQC